MLLLLALPSTRSTGSTPPLNYLFEYFEHFIFVFVFVYLVEIVVLLLLLLLLFFERLFVLRPFLSATAQIISDILLCFPYCKTYKIILTKKYTYIQLLINLAWRLVCSHNRSTLRSGISLYVCMYIHMYILVCMQLLLHLCWYPLVPFV